MMGVVSGQRTDPRSDLRTNRPDRACRRGGRGQVMVVFVLLSVVLFALLGLAVDGGVSYLAANAAERAAAAGALAGVPYMPDGFGSTADAAALAGTARNGFTKGDTTGGRNVQITVAQFPAGCGGPPAVACDDHKLTVTASEWVNTTFLRLMGFGQHQVVRVATALYLPPIALGQPGGQLGSDLTNLGDHANGGFYIIRQEGWGTDRSQGDAYTTDPMAPGNGQPACDQAAGYGSTNDVHQISAANGTDIAAPVAATPGTLTAAPYNFNALPSRGGYNYLVTVPTGVAGADLQVFNPAFAPDGGYNPNGSGYNLHEQDPSFSNYGDKTQYSVMAYTLFKVVDKFDHTQDQPLSQLLFNPINAQNAGSTGGNGPFTDMRTGQTTPAATVYHQWVSLIGAGLPGGVSESGGAKLVSRAAYNIGTTLAPGTYRLRVDALDWQAKVPGDDAAASQCSSAHKGSAIKVTGPGGTTATCTNGTTTCTLSGLEDLGLYTPVNGSQGGGTFDIPLFYVPTDYAGLTVNVYVFDPGDVSGGASAFLGIVAPGQAAPLQVAAPQQIHIYDLGVSRANPATTPLTPPAQPSAQTATVQTYSQGGSPPTPYNSHWLLFQIPIPSGYNAPGYWNLRYTTTAIASDTITVAVGFGGVSVHLLP